MLDGQRKFQDAQNNIAISRNNDNATREKAEIDLKKKLVDVNTTYANKNPMKIQRNQQQPK